MKAVGRGVVKLGTPVLAVVLVFVVWDLIVRIFHVQSFVVPSPGAAFDDIRTNWSDTLAPLTQQTILETGYGFVLGAVIGFVLAIGMAQLAIVQRLVYPALVASQAVPIVAIAAPLVIILGFGVAPKIVIVAWIVFFPVVVNVIDGLANVDRDLLSLSKVMGGSRWRVFALIELPATVVPLFSALKIGATYAVTGAVIGEWTASADPGLGNYLTQANSALNAAGVYGATILLTTIGVGSFLIIFGLEKLMTPWRSRSTARSWFHKGPPTVQSVAVQSVAVQPVAIQSVAVPSSPGDSP